MDDPRLQALSDACQLAQSLKDGAVALTDRSRKKGGKDPMTLAQGCNSLEKAVAEVEELIRQLDDALAALAEATSYRGDVTLELKDGSSIEGYVFDLKRGGSVEHAVRILPRDGRSRMTVAQSQIQALIFTGKDAAAGKTWDNWIRRYAEKKLKGEAAGIESEPLE